MSQVTRLLSAASAGDRQAAADLLPLVYEELRKLAAVRMAGEAPGHSLNATALTHEAYLRLVGDQGFEGRAHFFAAAAEAMRRILVDNARAKRAQKRGAGQAQADLDPEDQPAAELDADRWLDLDEALTRFASIDPSAAELEAARLRRAFCRRDRRCARHPACDRVPDLDLCPGLVDRQACGRPARSREVVETRAAGNPH